MVRLPVADRPTLARPAPALTLRPRLLAVNRSGPIFFDLRKMSPISAPYGAPIRASLPRLFRDDEPEKQVHHFTHAEQPEEGEANPDERRVHAEELGQATAHTSEEAA